MTTVGSPSFDYADRLSSLADHYSFLSPLIGHQPYFLVGGCVRDILLGLSHDPHDIDISLAAYPDDLRASLQNKSLSGLFRTEKYGTISFTRDQYQYEITPFRQESGYHDKRHPTDITRSDDLLEDAVRRDFSLNCLYYTYFQGNVVGDDSRLADFLYTRYDNLLVITDHASITAFCANPMRCMQQVEEYVTDGCHVLIDPFGGLACLRPCVLHAVGNPLDRLYEDSLRIVRALRFVSVLGRKIDGGCDIGKTTRTALKQTFYLVKRLPKERIYKELMKVLNQGSILCFVSLCEELNILKDLFPSLAACKNIDQPVRYHPFDVYAHTLLCLNAADQRNVAPLVKLALVFHDVGKPDQYYAYSMSTDKAATAKVTDLNHRTSSARIAYHDLLALGLSTKEIDLVCRYINHHHHPEQILAAKQSKRKHKVTVMLTECGDKDVMINLRHMAQCDRIGQMNPLQRNAYRELEELIDLTNDIVASEGIHTIKDLCIDGHALMRHFAIAPGPIIGEMLQGCFTFALGDRTQRNNEQVLFRYRETMTKQKIINEGE